MLRISSRQSPIVTGATTALPPYVVAKLSSLGIEGEGMLHIRSDLDAAGKWGERYLVATEQRVVVLTVGDTTGRGPVEPSAVTFEFDVALSRFISVEAKTLVGAAALEARLRPDPGTVNGGPPTDHVVELLRSSNAHSKEISFAARRLKQLLDHSSPTDEIEDGEQWTRRLCPTCGRALSIDSNVCPFCVNRLQALRRLLGYLGPYKWYAIGNGVLSILGIALSLVPQIIFAHMVDSVFTVAGNKQGVAIEVAHPPNAYHMLAVYVGMILAASVTSAVVSIWSGRNTAYLGARVIHDVRSQLYAQLQRLSLAFYDKREVGAVMSRVQNDTGMLQNFLLDGAQNMVISTLTILFVGLVLFSRNWMLALVVMLPVPFVVFGTLRYWRGLMKLWRRVWHQNSSLGARLADSLNGVRVVRAFAQEDREVDRFRTKSGELRDATYSVEGKAAVFYPILGFVMGLGAPLVWYFGGGKVLDGTMTLGSLTLFTGLLGRLYDPIQQLTRLVNFTTRAMTAAERVFEILDTTPEIREAANPAPMPRVNGRVEFKDVTFGYDIHRPVLHGINLLVEPGEMIGLVGHSGAGKSTLINLLMRFYEVNEGTLSIDGIDIRAIKRDDLRHQIGVVLQDPYLFHGSVFDNIAYGKPGATPAEVMSAAKAAYAHDYIVKFPDGYDTLVGERGTRLSGGERQRISIARAILHDPRILILDEATASVDTQTEQQIQMALSNLIAGRTTFAIAHRLSTLRHANRLVVLEGGQIVEQGTHDELMARQGVFHKLVNAQRAMSEVCAVGG